VTGKAFYDIGHAPANHSNRRSTPKGYAVWEIHPVAAEKQRRLLEMTPAKNAPVIRVAVAYIAWCVYMRDMAREMLQPSLMSASPTLSHDIPVPQPSDHLFWPEQPSPRLYSVGRPLPKNS
jgi:hypothetical protein